MAIKLSQQDAEKFVKLAQQGDTNAFAHIYDHYVDPIYRYIFYKTGREEALDLTETVFLKVWEHLKSYKHAQTHFSAWIFRIAHNVVIDHYRTHKNYVNLQTDLPDEKHHIDPITITEQKLTQEILQKAIGKLRKNYQQIIILKYVNELGNDEIARIIGKSEGSIRILKFRALRELRKILKNMNIPDASL